MAQFDVYANPNASTSQAVPFLLDVQCDLLDQLATRVVVPLVKASAMGKAARYLNPFFEVEGQSVCMSTPELAGIPLNALGTRIGSLADHRYDIIAALDFLFTGI